MSIFSKNALSSFFGLSGEDEYDNYDEYEEQKVVNQQPRQTVRQATAQVQKPTEPLTEKPSARYRSTETHQNKNESRQETAFNEKKVVSMRSSNNSNKRSQDTHNSARSGKITIIEPRVYSEAMNIAKHIIASDAVLVNFHLVEENQARRIVDFLTGTVYALDGDIQRVGDEIFLCTPSNIEIDSATAQSLAKKQMFDF
ncbi:cell division protein SepF [Enterococcus quebecensis]|uniref:Cell division protein SepF n=1 Tax=Enterococcus quebecensis TaxID=903983 RepID=A0A1E5GWP0_9ENTE|nr:cell division protein SepF [Enterococcus quebecensis]OEG17124.1 cell division protein SepF [Enterococcus quebecensis]OJG75510.1 cell division protein sepF [Enterococcus quebecensis]